jgi:hypothetical protein
MHLIYEVILLERCIWLNRLNISILCKDINLICIELILLIYLISLHIILYLSIAQGITQRHHKLNLQYDSIISCILIC